MSFINQRIKKVMLKTKIFTKKLVKSSKSLKFFSFNCCSVQSKVPQICDFLTNQNIGIALLQEIWLKNLTLVLLLKCSSITVISYKLESQEFLTLVAVWLFCLKMNLNLI